MQQVSGTEAKTLIYQCRGKPTARYGPLAFYIKDDKVAITHVWTDHNKQPTEEELQRLKEVLPCQSIDM